MADWPKAEKSLEIPGNAFSLPLKIAKNQFITITVQLFFSTDSPASALTFTDATK